MLLNAIDGWGTVFNILLKITSWAGLDGSELIFHLKAHSLTFAKWFLSKKSFDHLIPPFVFGMLKNLKDTTGFQIYHHGLILELVLLAKLCQRLSICLKTLLLPRVVHLQPLHTLISFQHPTNCCFDKIDA